MDLGSFSFSNEDSRAKDVSSPSTPKDLISWRLSADESYSDWTIILNIVQRDEGILKKHQSATQVEENDALQTVFHVHKVFLGAGKRGSLYFDRLFKSDHLMRENQNSTSIIDVERSAALAFPILLDYLYSVSKPLQATEETAVALRWLSTYLGMESVFHEVNQFIETHFTASTAPLYFREAALYHDEKMLLEAKKSFVQNLESLHDKDKTLQLSPGLFSSILDEAIDNFPSIVLSQVVAKYWKSRREEISVDMVREWTDPSFMDTIAPDSAIPLLHAADVYSLDQASGDGRPSLKHRCVDTVSREWRTSLAEIILGRDDIPFVDANLYQMYSDISTSTKCEMLGQALIAADRKLEDVEAKYEALIDIFNKLERVPASHVSFSSRGSLPIHSNAADVPDLSTFGLGRLGMNGTYCRQDFYNTNSWFPMFYFKEG